MTFSGFALPSTRGLLLPSAASWVCTWRNQTHAQVTAVTRVDWQAFLWNVDEQFVNELVWYNLINKSCRGSKGIRERGGKQNLTKEDSVIDPPLTLM